MSKLNQGDNVKDLRTAIQHGECLLVPVKSIPIGKTERIISKIVAHSETGHHHVIESKTEFETIGSIDKKDLYLRLFEPAKLVHKKTADKHKTLTVPIGDWKILHKSEYDPWAKVIRDVKD